jgi:hypothetical protein
MFAKVKRQLFQKVHKCVEKEGAIVDLDDASPSTFVVAIDSSLFLTSKTQTKL